MADPGGCSSRTIRNPDFDLSRAEAREIGEAMAAEPVELERPIVVLGGWRQGFLAPPSDSTRLIARLTGAPDARTLTVGYPLAWSIESLDDKVVGAVQRRWPSASPDETTEVDVIAISMGGLVARRAAREDDGRKRLKIRRLFTIGTPHRGARLASTIIIDPASCAMRPGSPFLSCLDEGLERAEYELYCYTRLNDRIVGATNTAPSGMQPYWLSGSAILSHLRGRNDPRIFADIARRLRGEEPIARRPTTPPMD